MSHKEDALERFSNGNNCAQSVFTVFAEDAQLNPEQAWRIAALFGGGIARTGHTCGAVTGALMALGLLAAKYTPQDSDAKDRLNVKAQQFVEKFEQMHRKSTCKELIGYDIHDPADHHKARESGVFNNRCPLFVESAVILLEELLKQLQEIKG